MTEIKVYSTGTNLENFGGAQKVMVDIHNGIKSHFDAKILGVCDFKDLNPNYHIQQKEYVRLKNPFKIRGAVVLLHARKITTYYAVLNKMFFLNLKLIYISHNIYNEKRWLTFLPEYIVSISDKVTQNLKTYFGVDEIRITKIHNGISEQHIDCSSKSEADLKTIKILYSARITDVKRQVSVVNHLKGKLPDNVKIYFAGTGPLFDELKKAIIDSNNFIVLGFVSDMKRVISECDFLMLFSVKEGLPISLMEGVMFGKPLIINDVGGNTELGIAGENAFLANDWAELVSVLNNLPESHSEEYKRLSVNSRNIYETYFRYDTMIDKYVNLIKTVFYGKKECATY